jgi:hypothetical protein
MAGSAVACTTPHRGLRQAADDDSDFLRQHSSMCRTCSATGSKWSNAEQKRTVDLDTFESRVSAFIDIGSVGGM